MIFSIILLLLSLFGEFVQLSNTHHKVNVGTGRKGWYKRTNAVDKTASLSIRVHDSDDSIDANPDLHNRVFSKLARALQSSHEAIDGLSLPFFQLGGHPNQLQVGLRGGGHRSGL